MIYDEKELSSSFNVNFNYKVSFTSDVFNRQNPTLINILRNDSVPTPSRAMVFIDSGLAEAMPELYLASESYFRHYSAQVRLVCSPILITGGERIKNQSRVFLDLVNLCDKYNLDRHAYVLAIGGGSVIDTVGFATSLVHRGVRQIRIPTTTLAQCDAAIGIKNGINFKNKKNLIGSFYPPFAVVNDSRFLKTLDNANWRNGIAEAVKIALIKDPLFFEWIESVSHKLKARSLSEMNQLITRCAQLHLEHIANCGDPFERRSCRPLDFGHWAAHKLEQMSGFSIPHGHAVAIGICLDTLYAFDLGLLSDSDKNRVLECLKRVGFQLWHPALLKRDSLKNLELLAGLEEFREHLGGELSVTLLKGIGHSLQIGKLEPDRILYCLKQLARTADSPTNSPPHSEITFDQRVPALQGFQ